MTCQSPFERTAAFAHRGGFDSGFRENSLRAFRDSLDRTAMIETDVRLSADGVPVLCHDPIAFTRGIPVIPRLLPVAWLERLGVPTLAELLALLPERFHVSIDLKEVRAWPAVVQLARATGLSDHVWLVHDDIDVLRSIRAFDPDIRLVHEARVTDLTTRGWSLLDHPARLAIERIDAQNTHAGTWTEALVTNAHEHGVLAFGSLVQTPESMAAGVALGLDALYSDHVADLLLATTPPTEFSGPPSIEGVLFDFGTTLFAHAPGWQVVAAWATSRGQEISDDDARRIWQRIDDAAMDPSEVALGRDLSTEVWGRRWKVLYALADDELPGLGAELHRSFHDPEDWVPYADTASTLAALHDLGVPIGILSNTGWDISAVFDHYGFRQYLTSITTSYDAGAVKPDPSIFRQGCDAIGVSPDKVLMVGDDPVADRGALAAGLADLVLLDPATPPGATHGLGRAVELVRASRQA